MGAAAFGVFTGPAADIWFYKGDTMVAIGLITGGATTPPKDQAIVLAKQGDTAPDIARALGVSRRAVQTWVAAYNRGGLDALPDRPHPGRAPILPRAEEGRFLERSDTPPRPEDGGVQRRPPAPRALAGHTGQSRSAEV